MKSTGEVMGVGDSFGEAFAKASLGASDILPRGGRAFLSVKDSDKENVLAVAKDLVDLGFSLVGTSGTQRVLLAADIECGRIQKVNEGRPDVSDMLKNEQIDLIINTTRTSIHRALSGDSPSRVAKQGVLHHNANGWRGFCIAIRQGQGEQVRSLQDLHSRLKQG